MRNKNKLLPKRLLERFAEVGSQDDEDDPVVIAHYKNNGVAADWFMIEYDPTDEIFFGYASIFRDWNDEWGYIPLSDLISVETVVLDNDFKEDLSSNVLRQHYNMEP